MTDRSRPAPKHAPLPEPGAGPRPSLGVLLFIPGRHLEQRVLEAVHEAGYPITLAQARIAQRIDDGGSRLTRLAEASQVTKPTAGYLVDQLEKAGYVERVPDPRDARARLVRFTARGRSVIAVARTAQDAIEQEWREHLGAERTRALVETLADLRTITDPYLED